MSERDKKEKVVEAEVVENDNVEEVVEEVKPSKAAKAKQLVKKFGKKIAIGVAVGAGMIISYAFGRRSATRYDDDDDCYDELDDDSADTPALDCSEPETEEPTEE